MDIHCAAVSYAGEKCDMVEAASQREHIKLADEQFTDVIAADGRIRINPGAK